MPSPRKKLGDGGFSTVMRLAKFAGRQKKKKNRRNKTDGGGGTGPAVSSRDARAAARTVEAVRQDGTMEVDMTHILQIAQRPAAHRTLKEMDILAVWLSNKLRKNQLFDSITIAMCTALAQDAQITSLSPTENLFCQGDEGRNFYILLSGELTVHIGGRVLALLGSGASVGELALVKDDKRSATVQAVGGCILLRISKKSYQRNIKSHQAGVIEEKIAFLQSMYLFKKFTKNELHAFTMFFQQIMVRSGTTVYSKGDAQHAIYFIRSGRCEAVYTRPPEVLKLRRGSRVGGGGGGGGRGGGGSSGKTRLRAARRAAARASGGANNRGSGGSGGGGDSSESTSDEDDEDAHGHGHGDSQDDDGDDDDSDGAAQRRRAGTRQAGRSTTAAGRRRLPSPRHVDADDFHSHRQKAALFEQGQWFGDLSVFTDNIARYTVVAKGPTVLWRLQQERLPQLEHAFNLLQEAAAMKLEWRRRRDRKLKNVSLLLERSRVPGTDIVATPATTAATARHTTALQPPGFTVGGRVGQHRRSRSCGHVAGGGCDGGGGGSGIAGGGGGGSGNPRDSPGRRGAGQHSGHRRIRSQPHFLGDRRLQQPQQQQQQQKQQWETTQEWGQGGFDGDSNHNNNSNSSSSSNNQQQRHQCHRRHHRHTTATAAATAAFRFPVQELHRFGPGTAVNQRASKRAKEERQRGGHALVCKLPPAGPTTGGAGAGGETQQGGARRRQRRPSSTVAGSSGGGGGGEAGLTGETLRRERERQDAGRGLGMLKFEIEYARRKYLTPRQGGGGGGDGGGGGGGSRRGCGEGEGKGSAPRSGGNACSSGGGGGGSDNQESKTGAPPRGAGATDGEVGGGDNGGGGGEGSGRGDDAGGCGNGCGGGALQSQVLGSLIMDFNNGDPDLTPAQRYLLRVLGDQEERAAELRARKAREQPHGLNTRRPHPLWK